MKHLKISAPFLALTVAIVSIAALVVACGSSGSSGSETNDDRYVLTASYPAHALTEAVAGDLFDVRRFTDNDNIDPHNFEPLASELVQLRESEGLFYINLVFEEWVSEQISASPDVSFYRIGNVEATSRDDDHDHEGEEGDEHDHEGEEGEEGDEHGHEGEEGGHEGAVAHAIPHIQLGPFVNTQLTDMASTAPQVSEQEHTGYVLATMEGVTNYARYLASEDGEFVFVFSETVTLSVTNSSGATVEIEETLEHDDSEIAAVSYLIDLSAGEYTLALSDVNTTEVTLAVETIEEHAEGEDEHGHEGEEGDEHAHEGEEVHADSDPHEWLNVPSIIAIVRNIDARLSQIDPSNSAEYTANANAYIATLEEAESDVAISTNAQCRFEEVLATSNTLAHLAEEYGFKAHYLITSAHDHGGSSVSGRAIQDLITEGNELGVTHIVDNSDGNMSGKDAISSIAEEIGAEVVTFRNLELAPTDGTSYVDEIKANLMSLSTALGC